MPALYLTEADVQRFLPMGVAIEAMQNVFRKQALTEVANIPRGRARTDHGMIHVMGAAAKTIGYMACKVYTTTRSGTRFLVQLYDGKTGELKALLEADSLGAIRTGATSGLATSHMARLDADTVGVFGSGKQARTQLEAVCKARQIVEGYVYSRSPEGRERFAEEMTAVTGVKIVAVSKPELAAEDKDIIVTATTSAQPVLKGEWIRPGAHLNVIGSNFLAKAEVDVVTLREADVIVVDDKEQARIEAGDFVQALDEGVLRWSDISELSAVVVNRVPGRHTPEDITVFKSVGVAFCDLAAAKVVYERAMADGVGITLPF
jgi:alanine dehydrogenase